MLLFYLGGYFPKLLNAFCDKTKSSNRRCSMKKRVLKNFEKFTEKYL